MEHKLFYKDPYISQFSAKVVEQRQDHEGQAFVILSETAFYPTGGGQPYDTGWINGIRVVKVEEVDGELRHYLEGPLPEDNRVVNCELNWTRRFDHMQQHSGQHILTAAFEQLFGYQTVSFHLGKETLTIDLNIEELAEEEALLAEKKANQIVMESRMIETKWVAPEELADYPLRKEVSVSEDIRLVIIPDYDYNGCGGTHPKNTAETGPIKILGWEKHRKQIRVEFVCGERVLNQLEKKHEVLQQLTGLLSTPEGELVDAVQKLLEGNNQLKKLQEEAMESLLYYEAKELLDGHSEGVITKVYVDRSIQELQKLAKLVTVTDGDKMVVFIAENEDRLQIICASGEQTNRNMKSVIKEILPIINGKGGGSPNFAQGGGAATISGMELMNKLEENGILR